MCRAFQMFARLEMKWFLFPHKRLPKKEFQRHKTFTLATSSWNNAAESDAQDVYKLRCNKLMQSINWCNKSRPVMNMYGGADAGGSGQVVRISNTNFTELWQWRRKKKLICMDFQYSSWWTLLPYWVSWMRYWSFDWMHTPVDYHSFRSFEKLTPCLRGG